MKRFSFLLFILFISCSVGLNFESAKTGIEGYVLSTDKSPVADAYVYLYRSLSSGLIGPADFMEKTDEKGYFFFDVPEGKYYLVARKRWKGGDAGPLREGDRSAIYNKNPIEVKISTISKAIITLPEGSSLFQKKMPMGDKSLTIKFNGELKKGLKILVYEGEDIKKNPTYIIEFTEKEKNINLYSNKKYVIVIRESLRERIGENEFFKIFGPFFSDDISKIEIDPQ